MRPSPLAALVALGSNLPGSRGNPAEQVAAAMARVAALGRDAAFSRLFQSPAWPPGGPDYVNAAMSLSTDLDAPALLAALHGIEAGFGRTRAARWGARTLDLDLLALGATVLPDAATQAAWRDLPPEAQGRAAPETLILPHPRLQDRAFVLVPLLDVAPFWRHPLLGLTVEELAARLPPGLLDGVRPLANPGPAP